MCGTIQESGSLKSLLWYALQLSGASILCFHIPSFLRAHQLTIEGCNHWWLWHPYLLIWQVEFLKTLPKPPPKPPNLNENSLQMDRRPKHKIQKCKSLKRKYKGKSMTLNLLMIIWIWNQKHKEKKKDKSTSPKLKIYIRGHYHDS